MSIQTNNAIPTYNEVKCMTSSIFFVNNCQCDDNGVYKVKGAKNLVNQLTVPFACHVQISGIVTDVSYPTEPGLAPNINLSGSYLNTGGDSYPSGVIGTYYEYAKDWLEIPIFMPMMYIQPILDDLYCNIIIARFDTNAPVTFNIRILFVSLTLV